MNNQESFRYLRVNSKGHLVALKTLDNTPISETSGSVIHPGTDFSFTFKRDQIEMNQLVGSLFYQLHKDKSIDVEGNVYLVSPYLGDFTPAASQPNLLKKTQEISFKKGVGLVKEVCHSVYGKGFFETRLVSATVVN